MHSSVIQSVHIYAQEIILNEHVCSTRDENEQVVSPDGDCDARFHEKLELESVLSPNDEKRAVMTSREASTTFP